MACKFAVVAFCLFIVGYVDAADNDAWSVLSGEMEFFMVTRSYRRGDGTNECPYMKQQSKDESARTLTTLMGYRDGSTKQFIGPVTYTVTAQADATGAYNVVTVTGGPSPLDYELVHTDGNGCNILKGKEGLFDGKCELWAPPGQVANAQEDACSKQFETLCGEVLETPYKSDCAIP
uniref:Moubatin-like 4 n=1 Tax=Ornithodoros parkeri TaxID=140564 RepID=A6N9X9_ORNPR|nr:moubatin-like 4 [Ornithodoros parkeri]